MANHIMTLGRVCHKLNTGYGLLSCLWNRAGSEVLVYGRRFHNTESRPWKPDLYVFDKYGTLVNIHHVWTPWVQRLSARLETSTGIPLQEKMFSALDICSFSRRVRSGVIGDGTTWQVKQKIESLLYQEGFSWRESQLLIEQSWEDCVITDTKSMKQLERVKHLFKDIKADGAKIAVCSSDLHARTLEMLERTSLIDLVDSVMSTDTEDNISSGDGHVANICKDLGIEASRAVVIGDTRGDMELGRVGDVALTVGVLSGIGTRLDFLGVADFVTDNVFQAVEKVQALDTTAIKRVQDSRNESVNLTESKADLVIFDKDGTLLCFHSLWTPWGEDMIAKLETTTGLKLGHKVWPVLGFSEVERKWRPSVFTQGTTRQSKDKVAEILKEEGVQEIDVHPAIDKSWSVGDHTKENADLRPLDDPAAIFKALKSMGIKVAVCTSDCRKGTEDFLVDLGAAPFVDMVVCGDDPDSTPKPAADNALMICERLGVDPARAVMVGDTNADMHMGRAAKLGATVAVLSGVGDVHHLAPDADHILPSIGHILEVIKQDK